jgi:hypothetical protein
MTNVSSSNALPSDAAWPTVTQKARPYPTTDEGIFLRQQAADAKTAMQRTVADIGSTAKAAVDVRWWTQQYSWYAVGTAAVVGLVTAAYVLAPTDCRAHATPPTPKPAAGPPSWLLSLVTLGGRTLLGMLVDALRVKNQPTAQTQTDADVG